MNSPNHRIPGPAASSPSYDERPYIERGFGHAPEPQENAQDSAAFSPELHREYADEPAHFAPDAPPLRADDDQPPDYYDPEWTGEGEIGRSEAVAQVDLERIEQILASEHFRPRQRRPDFVPPPPPPVQKRSSGIGWAAGTFVVLVAASAFVAYQVTERRPLLDTTADPSVLTRVASLFGAQQSAVEETTTPPAAQPQAPAPQAAAPAAPAQKAYLAVNGASADSPDRILLGVSAHGTVDGMNAVVGGLEPGTQLTSGRPWGATGWILPAAELETTYLMPPAGFSGVMEYTVSLQHGDNRVLDRQTMRLEWAAPAAQQPAMHPQQTQNRQISDEEVASMLSRGEALLMQGDIASARLLLQRAADAQDARAALALASTYDPIEMRRLGVYGATPDVDRAREWYEKARQYGSREAPRRLELLASQFR